MQVGAPEELYRRPANIFVARFIGSPKMNLIEAGGDVAFGSLRLGGRRQIDGKALLVGVRPEDIRLLGDGEGDGIAGRVRLVESLGAEYYVHVETAAGELVVRVMDRRSPRAAGEVVTLRPETDAVHVFDRASGERVEPFDSLY
jgi:ABC-type sugar transport system ATPase subunit